MKFFMTLLLLTSVLSGCATMKAIDQGLYSATETVTERDRLSGKRSLCLADREEQTLKGNEFVEKFIAEARAEGKKVNEEYDLAAYKRIKRIFEQLHQVSHLRQEAWTPVIIEEDSWNAFTTGGTYFVIFSALEKDLKDDSELANVIAHEMAHTVANHAFERRDFQQINALAGSKSAKRDTFQAAFTHENETEADQIAVLYCSLAGFDPYAGGRIWERMHKKSGNDALFIHDHPMNEERAAEAKRVADLVQKYYVPGTINSNYQQILEDNELFSLQKSELAAGEGGGFFAALDAALSTYQQKQKAKLEERRQKARIEFMRSVHRVSKIVGSEAMSANKWRFTILYRGNRPLTDLSFKAIIRNGSKIPLTITQGLDGVLNPNTTFYVDFSSPELDAYHTNSNDIAFMYDNAKAL
ncbi:hypothetical protein A7E78_03845 [Syntrophotalea acetylenivorans]|uniref:Peptidase M48 domain-containing protein n=1 Tax=Syntrophotalea acetylenivorans TaxID=1842532 RepID=A0A1L3GMB8_9BACT|nr:M48 family metallopeptidase [Syntrophotalea acetylenivorans]APG27040.1 hypothetical protein A7E78_03845 [Syntrophotalea acetylenivorans]